MNYDALLRNKKDTLLYLKAKKTTTTKQKKNTLANISPF